MTLILSEFMGQCSVNDPNASWLKNRQTNIVYCTKQPESKHIKYVCIQTLYKYNKECNVHYTIRDHFLGV